MGFDHCALTPLSIPSRDQQAYLDWCEAGSAGTMEYLTRDPKKRTQPETAFPGANAVLCLAVSYYQGPIPPKPGLGYGRVARYAWGLDYHAILVERLQKLLAEIQRMTGPDATFYAVDTKPLLERALALQAGVGFVGKNTMLIMNRSSTVQFHVGSFVFLAEILMRVDSVMLERADVDAAVKSSCGTCTRCLTACPTDAFDGPYRLRANKCISYLTIESKGAIPLEMRAAIGDWLFGCDVCQDVCPFNARAYETKWPELQADKGVGAWVSLEEILSLPDDGSFKKRFGATPLSRPKRCGLIRNACVAAGNSGDRTLLAALEPLARDADPLIQEHAQWAFEKLST